MNSVLEEAGYPHRLTAGDVVGTGLTAEDLLAASFAPGPGSDAVTACYRLVLAVAPATASACVRGEFVEVEGSSLATHQQRTSGLGSALQLTRCATPKVVVWHWRAERAPQGAGASAASGGGGAGAGEDTDRDVTVPPVCSDGERRALDTGEPGEGRRIELSIGKHLRNVEVLRLPGGLPPDVDEATYLSRLDDWYYQLLEMPESALCAFKRQGACVEICLPRPLGPGCLHPRCLVTLVHDISRGTVP